MFAERWGQKRTHITDHTDDTGQHRLDHLHQLGHLDNLYNLYHPGHLYLYHLGHLDHLDHLDQLYHVHHLHLYPTFTVMISLILCKSRTTRISASKNARKEPVPLAKHGLHRTEDTYQAPIRDLSAPKDLHHGLL